MTSSEVASGSSTPAQFTTSMRGPSSTLLSVGTEEDTISTGYGSSNHSNAPSAIMMTPVDGTQRPYSSTNPQERDRSPATTEDVMSSSESSGSTRSTLASKTTETTETGVMNDFTTSTRVRPWSTLSNGHGTLSTTGAEVGGSHRSTTLNPALEPTTGQWRTGQMPSITTRKATQGSPSNDDVDGQDRPSPSETSGTLVGSIVSRSTSTSATENDGSHSTSRKTSATSDFDDEKNPTLSPPVSSSSLKGSTVNANVPPTTSKNDESFSITTPPEGHDATPSKESQSNADNSPSLTPSTAVNGNSQSNKSTLSSPLPTVPMIGGGVSRTTTPTVTDKDQLEQKTTTQSGGNDPNNPEATTRRLEDVGRPAITDGDGKASSKYTAGRSSRTSTATGHVDGSADRTTKTSNEDGNESASSKTTTKADASVNDLTTTSFGDYLQNIKLNLSSDFDLDDLNEEQKKNLEDLSNAYGLDVSVISKERLT